MYSVYASHKIWLASQWHINKVETRCTFKQSFTYSLNYLLTDLCQLLLRNYYLETQWDVQT
jgi:hypothetical protein